MASGFYEIQGGTQPALPSSGFGRLWYNTATQSWSVLLSDGTNIPIQNVANLTEKTILLPDDEVSIWDPALSAYRKIKAKNLSPLAIQNRFLTYDEDEFAGTTTAGKLNWAITTNGTGASGQTGTYGVNGTEKAFGVLQIDTGTTATGRAVLNRLVNQIQLGYSEYEQVWRLALEELSTGTERFFVQVGFIDNTAAGEPVDGVYFRYSDNVNSGNWQCICREGSVETVSNTSVAANTNYNIFRININSAGTSAEFRINNVLVATVATNIPSTAGNLTGIGVKIEKTVGTTQRNLSVDYFTQEVFWSGGR